ncbi:hypothetical protein NQ314_008459 [Rhamnusium bicolor]|uniref:PiggyBac transposable element-derived protein domain-containing protein n=1 Tax=Rhamnusium bicolor TaxID=1586634 RepID=A0AAV8YBG8_9CUCU|nr:hypothetical protein NQ314_008459 [Rhamnusium bicolor]
MWSLNTKQGYLVNFDLYQGINPCGNKNYDTLFGKAASPLVLMLDELHVKNVGYNIHVDNLFTGSNLFAYLRYLGYEAVGTIRDNRLPKPYHLEDKKQFAKRQRGASQYILEKSDGILFVKWMDNSVVTMASTGPGVSPFGTVKRSEREAKYCSQSTKLYCSV